jgi:hypothetical protein
MAQEKKFNLGYEKRGLTLLYGWTQAPDSSTCHLEEMEIYESTNRDMGYYT